jgi:predicted transcriptional regulator
MAAEETNITDTELEILQVLWKRKQATVKEVHEMLSAARDTGYTTILKQMQVMHEKGLLKRDDSHRQHIYSPVPSQKKVQRRFMDKLMRSAFGGSAGQLVLQALSSYKTSSAELDEIQSLIEKVKSGKGSA